MCAPHVVESGKDANRSVEPFGRGNRQDSKACERTQHGISSRLYGISACITLFWLPAAIALVVALRATLLPRSIDVKPVP